MSATREKILQTLLSQQQCTINELAEAVGINPISVRHHIIKLQAEGVVDAEEERHGVGRPRRIYFLTEDGFEKFPTRYLRLTNRLLEQIKDLLPDAPLGKIFTQMGENMAEELIENTNLKDLPIESRLVFLKGLLEQEGFTVELEKKGDEYHIKEMNCPYYHVGQSHPEVCSVDQTLISSVLAIPADKVQCILNGDSYCTYVVSTVPLSSIQTSE